jgi:hypothetical protein
VSLLAHGLCALLLSADPFPSGEGSVTAVVQPGETLLQLARRTVGDEAAASEIKALNQLAEAPLQPGQQLKVPGPERGLAVSAVSAARRVLAQMDAGAAGRTEAGQRLAEAEAHLRNARYGEATRAADAAWQLVSDTTHLKAQFTVEVNHEGRTEVMTRTGQPVRVEAEGVTQVVHAGQKLTVEKGQPPPRPVDQLPPPSLSAPADRVVLKLKPTTEGLGPVALSWKAVAGARGYEVEVTVGDGKAPLLIKTTRPEAKLPPLPAGRYQWAVRSVAEEIRSELSPRRWFELQAEQIRLEVRGAGWK